MDREHITESLTTGVRAIDALMTCGKGQRMGLFGGSGVGKSTLLGMMAKNNSADVTVIALIGERNREVRAFLEQELGPEGSKRSVVVCSTSDRPAPLRVRACFVALAIAEYFQRSGCERSAHHGFGDAPRHGAARNWSRRRRASESEGIYALGLQSASAGSRTRRQLPTPGQLPDSLPFWWRATISTNRFAIRSAQFSMATLFCPVVWLRVDTIRRSMFSTRSAVFHPN